MATIYVVTSGVYSGYSIDAVFLRRENAEASILAGAQQYVDTVIAARQERPDPRGYGPGDDIPPIAAAVRTRDFDALDRLLESRIEEIESTDDDWPMAPLDRSA